MPEKLHCIRYRRATDTAQVSGLDVMYSLNLLTMGVAEPVAECQPRICDGRKMVEKAYGQVPVNGEHL